MQGERACETAVLQILVRLARVLFISQILPYEIRLFFFYKTINRPHHLAAAELRRQGNSLFQQGRTKEALEKYDKAAKMGEFFVVFEGN